MGLECKRFCLQARRTGSSSSGGKLHASPYNKQALVAALGWQHASLSHKNAEGSATSDEDHPRCDSRALLLLARRCVASGSAQVHSEKQMHEGERGGVERHAEMSLSHADIGINVQADTKEGCGPGAEEQRARDR